MIRRFLGAALLVGCVAGPAFGQDERVLSGRDDVAFAEKLRERGYPDLAAKLLDVIEGVTGNGNGEALRIRGLRLELAQDEALRLDDVLRRRDALLDVLAAKARFVAEFEGTPAAESVRATLVELGSAIAATGVVENAGTVRRQRLSADELFEWMERRLKARLADLQSVEVQSGQDEVRLESALYELAHARYFHALIFPKSSARRRALVEAALATYDDITWIGGGGSEEPSFFRYVEFLYVGRFLVELGRPDEALQQFDWVLALRESYGPADPSGVFPLGSPEVVELVCDATREKAKLLADLGRFGDAFRTGMDYFDSMPQPFAAPSSIRLLGVLGRPLIDGTAVLGHGDVERLVAACAKAFAGRPVLTKDHRRLDADLVRAEPDLAWAYLTWGVAERMAARVDHDESRLAHCRDAIFVPLVNTFDAEKPSELWWAATYHFVATMIDKGELKDAKLKCDDVQRQHPIADDAPDDSFGHRARLVELR